jgi:hypothetical protein
MGVTRMTRQEIEALLRLLPNESASKWLYGLGDVWRRCGKSSMHFNCVLW